MSTAWKHCQDLGVSETQALGSGIGNYSESMEAGSFTVMYKAVVIQAPAPSLPHLHWLSPVLLHSHNTGLVSVPVTLQVSPCSEPLSQILWLPGTPRYRPAGLPSHFTQVSGQISPPQKASLIVLSEDTLSLIISFPGYNFLYTPSVASFIDVSLVLPTASGTWLVLSRHH